MPPPPPAQIPGASASAAPPTPPAPPAPPSQRVTAREGQAPAPPDVRIGDGIAATYAELDEIGLLHPATADTGNLAPEYPPEAAQRGEQGTVVLRVTIGADGSVRRVDIARSSGWAILDRTARDRIATWHFHPATRDGKSVESVEDQAIRFLP